MLKKKNAVKILFITVLFIGWASIAEAWVYQVDMYSYIGNRAIKGTVIGATYWSRIGTATNDSDTPAELSVDLYYGTFKGQWQWSPDHGVRWFFIERSETNWTRTINSGDSVSFRVVLIDRSDRFYHYLSTSPYGVGDESLGDAYYFAYSPNSSYYSDFSIREVGPYGYVAVIKD